MNEHQDEEVLTNGPKITHMVHQKEPYFTQTETVRGVPRNLLTLASVPCGI